MVKIRQSDCQDYPALIRSASFCAWPVRRLCAVATKISRAAFHGFCDRMDPCDGGWMSDLLSRHADCCLLSGRDSARPLAWRHARLPLSGRKERDGFIVGCFDPGSSIPRLASIDQRRRKVCWISSGINLRPSGDPEELIGDLTSQGRFVFRHARF